MKKLFLSIVAVLALSLCFVACGGSKITVTFDGNGGVTKDGETQVVKQIDTNGSYVVPTFSREGYYFDGWDSDIKTLTKNTVVKAQWKAITYTVTFDLNGGTSSLDTSTLVTNNGKVVLPVATKNFYVFLGWYDGKTKVDNDTVYSKDTILVAKWQIESGVVILNFADTLYQNACENKFVYSNAKIGSLPVLKDSTDEYTFKGWYYLDGEKKVTVTSETILQLDETELTLYANWSSNWTGFY